MVKNIRTKAREDLIELLRARQRWYADGCPMVDGVENDYESSGDLARDAGDDLRIALELLECTPNEGQMEISIDRRGEGTQAVKIALAVRSLDNHTHSALTTVDRDAVSKVLVNAARDVEQIIITGRIVDGPRTESKAP